MRSPHLELALVEGQKVLEGSRPCQLRVQGSRVTFLPLLCPVKTRHGKAEGRALGAWRRRLSRVTLEGRGGVSEAG